MWVPILQGVIARRLLVNFRVKPEILEALLPRPFRPKLVRGWGMAGICLIRLEQLRPKFMPRRFGGVSENAAHRIAVEWTHGGGRGEGVFITRRDTDSCWNRLAGGRLFPGVHQTAAFGVVESEDRFKVEMRGADDEAFVRVAARTIQEWPAGSVFHSLAEASAFFEAGAFGWSPGRHAGDFEGLQLSTHPWRVEPLALELVESSFFQDPSTFPAGSVEFDCGLLMRGIPHKWRALGTMRVAPRCRRSHHGPSSFFEMP